MTLKLIPTESAGKNGFFQNGKKQKHFNPGNKLKNNGGGKNGGNGTDGNSDSSLKNICLKLVHFINRGSRFTYEQIDEVIIHMQRSILALQKKKQEVLKRKIRNKK